MYAKINVHVIIIARAQHVRRPPPGPRTWGRTATVGFGFNFERPYCSHESIQCRVKPLLGGSDEQAIYDLQFAYIPWFQAGQELRIYTGNSRGHLPRGSGAKLQLRPDQLRAAFFGNIAEVGVA